MLRYIFIEGVFYVEYFNRDSLKDVSGIINFCIENSSRWALDVDRRPASDFEIAPLSTPLMDVPMRASNRPLYLFVHQGSCEHLIHIKNIRLRHQLDGALELGPIKTHHPIVVIRKCSICTKNVDLRDIRLVITVVVDCLLCGIPEWNEYNRSMFLLRDVLLSGSF